MRLADRLWVLARMDSRLCLFTFATKYEGLKMRSSKYTRNQAKPTRSSAQKSIRPSIITVGNKGQDLSPEGTNYWDTEMAHLGHLFLSWNAGAGRLLVPDCLTSAIPEMLTGKLAVISRGAWPAGQKADAIEIMFDDDSNAPFSIHLAVEQCSQMLPDYDIGTEFPFTIWTRSGKVGEMPGQYRRADTLPCLKPWVKYKSNTTPANADSANPNAFESNSTMKSTHSSHDCLPEQLEEAKSKVEESGWSVDSIYADAAKMDAIYLYAFDYKTRWTWNCVLSRDKFDEIIQNVNSFTKAELCASVGGMISTCSKAKNIEPSMVNVLATVLALYIASTQTYEQTQRGRTHVHFMVIHYGQINKVRPMAAAGERFQINSASETVKSIVNTIEMDKRNHPDWF
jgi:hypothetical protein